MLAVDSIDTYYGDSHILHDVSMDVGENEIVGLLGRNGVGKTTTIRSIMGLTPPRNGQITFRGRDITDEPPDRIASMGIGYVPQGRQLFPNFSVLENLKMGFGADPIDHDRIEEMYDLFPRLEERSAQRASTLSGGEKQMVAIARALVSQPELLLLDEPTEGLMPKLVETTADVIEGIEERGYSIVLIEQNVDFVLDTTDRVYLMENGRMQHEAPAVSLREDQSAIDRYLGVS